MCVNREGEATEMHAITWGNEQIRKQPMFVATETMKEQAVRLEEN